MPGLNLLLGTPCGHAYPEPRNHRWQAPPCDWIESPAWLQREGRSAASRRPALAAAPVDTLAIALQADTRHAQREAWLGMALGAGVVALLVLGWLLPLLAAASVATPVVGIALAILDGRRRV